VVNQGISGDTTSGGLARVGMATKLKPAIAVLELGGNDGLRGLPIEETKANLEQMAAALAKSGAKVVIAGMTLPPNYGREYVRKFEQMYVDLAERNGYARIKFLLEGVWDQPGAMQADGIHPTVKGNEMVAKLVFRTIEPLLKK
jgi:acyl-CoA thioesterase-1